MSDASKAPIAIVAFNRPDYLREVLSSLARQDPGGLIDRPIALFQDGGFNEHSGVQRADPGAIDANIAVFREFFPAGEVMASPTNLGVALNFERAERWAFEALAAPAAIFLEDDLVLSPNYLRVLDRMLEMASRDRRIGYVAAYGDWRLPLAKQQEAPGQLIALGHHWAFGLTRRQWVRNQPFMEEYLALVRGHDYVHRPHAKILDMFSQYGLARVASSQDTAKSYATYLSGGLRLNTRACLARYIGKIGVHFREEIFNHMKFDQTEIYPSGEFEIELLSEARYAQHLAHQRTAALAVAPRLTPGGQISLAKGEPGEQAVRSGFYLSEVWGAWSDAKLSSIEVGIPGEPLGLGSTLWIDARYNLPRGVREIDVCVRVNGLHAGSISVGPKVRRARLSIPRESLRDDKLRISFHCPLIGSPHDFGWSEDRRPMSLGVAAVGLLAT